jgi:hypothetical protein
MTAARCVTASRTVTAAGFMETNSDERYGVGRHSGALGFTARCHRAYACLRLLRCVYCDYVFGF